MGKKHIIETNQEELIKNQEKIDKSVEKLSQQEFRKGKYLYLLLTTTQL